MKKIISNLLAEMKENGWDGISNSKDNLLVVNSKELMLEMMSTEEMDYKILGAVLLIIPEIWKDFNLSDWKDIIRGIERPKKYRLLLDEGPYFEDIRFLYNWIEIDSIKLYREDELISSENKERLDKVAPRFLIDTLKEGNYKEDFDDGTFGDYQYLTEMKERLIAQGATPVGD